MTTRNQLDARAAKGILILDGAMGSMIQGCKLTEADFRGSRFASHGTALIGCSDILCLTKPEIIAGIHEAYLQAGADIIGTCSFNATSVSLGDYGIKDLAYEISLAAARLAREAADRYATADKPRFVAGSLGPTAKSASISPDMEDPGKRSITWDELEAAYYDNARGLLDGGADILLIETIFDTLNAKAAIFAITRLLEERQRDVPLMLSATVADAAGRLLSGQTLRAFCVSVLHAKPWSLGLNCSFGAERLKSCIRDLAGIAPCLVSAHPNAGLPNEFGAYDETPETMASHLEAYMREGLVNIVGGCCGSTPAHIAAIAKQAQSYQPRSIPVLKPATFLAGLEPLPVGQEPGLTKIGERTNVAGCRTFLRLIREEKYREALELTRNMLEQGAAIIDMCMDDALLDAKAAMIRFITLALADPGIASAPIMIDSSRWEVIEAALKCIQGKSLVNSISLKEGAAELLRKSRLARRYGAAVVVMLFDEQGQAATYEQKCAVAHRSYAILTDDGFPPEDIVFDPNVLSVATGISEHDRYALEVIRASAWIREHCPQAQISGGISNLSFSFRGNTLIREAMHAVFLKHALDAGLTMAIVNPAALLSYQELDTSLRDILEDVILCRKGNTSEAQETVKPPTDRLLALAEKISAAIPANSPEAGQIPQTAKLLTDSWRSTPPEDRIIHAMVKGIDDYIEADVLEARPQYSRSLEVVEGPLMKGMQEVGDRFGKGQMFLPQVIRSARVMKKAVAALAPFINQEKNAAAGTESSAGAKSSSGAPTKGNGSILLATVKGDVHDIGKNIVAVVLGCNGYDILDLGIMVPAERIFDALAKEPVAIIGLSGLITPSLDEMVRIAREMERRGMTIPLMVGGAATSLAHTSLRIAPEYSGPVVYVPDASRSAEAVRALLSDSDRPRFLTKLETDYQKAAERHASLQTRIELLPLEAARKNRVPPAPGQEQEPRVKGTLSFKDYPVDQVIPSINWTGFLHGWDLGNGAIPGGPSRKEAEDKLLEDAHKLLERVSAEGILKLQGVLGFFPALSEGEDIRIFNHEDPGNRAGKRTEQARFSFLRNQERKRAGGPNPCLADFIRAQESPHTTGWIGLFALSAGFGLPEAEATYKAQHDDYGALLLGSLANCLAEAFAEAMHQRVRQEFWGYAPEETPATADMLQGKYQGIRPAFGYPACPDHEDKRIAFDLLQARERCGLALTESAMIIPAASVCGMFFSSPASYYFGVNAVGEDQIQDWAIRKGIGVATARKRLGKLSANP
ncbi:MAG: methionine synthase [Treponema sp.]|jgi:5-methyltetrahydrofolate--homocysteine methyltransferase|nr:methionine synthase [Treponema sp.]